jgi:DNA-binding NarL/FixJ family response regulator
MAAWEEFTGDPSVGESNVRVLLVDDYEPWRRFERLTLAVRDSLQIVQECGDGSEAIQKAEELKPDLILLDIGLPTVNGIEAARRIGEVSPQTKILFVSENHSPDIAEKALNTGAWGYVVKSDAARELLAAIRAVLEGKRFISASLAAHFVLAATLSTATQAISWFVTIIS